MKYRTEGLTEINQKIKDLEDQIIDIEWDDPDAETEYLQSTLKYLSSRRDLGDTYDPEF